MRALQEASASHGFTYSFITHLNHPKTLFGRARSGSGDVGSGAALQVTSVTVPSETSNDEDVAHLFAVNEKRQHKDRRRD